MFYPYVGCTNYTYICSVQFSRSVVSDFLRAHGLQHIRPLCPSPTQFTQTHIQSQWCHPTISSSVIPFSSHHQSFSASGSFQMRALCINGPMYWSFHFSIIPSNEYSGLISFRMAWLDLLTVQVTLKSLLQHHFLKDSVLWHSAFFTVQLSHPYMTTGKTLTRRTIVGNVMSLLLNMLTRLVITFLPRRKHLLISWLQSPSAVILEPPKIKSDTVSTVSPSICQEVMGPDDRILDFWMLTFKPIFHSPLSLSSRGSLVPLQFLPLEWYHMLIWGGWYFFWQSWFQLEFLAAQHFTWCTLL